MPFLRVAEVRSLARRATLYKNAEAVIREAAAGKTRFDVFLSHAVVDAELVVGVLTVLQDAGLSVYVDWYVDPQLDRAKVTAPTAEVLRKRMQQCDSLLYLWSLNAADSKWMPWELGYFDGHNGNVAVFPVVAQSDNEYRGTEFVGLYPTVDLETIAGKRVPRIRGLSVKGWIGDNPRRIVRG
jgi:TIR domain